jgi:hypothetical protein
MTRREDFKTEKKKKKKNKMTRKMQRPRREGRQGRKKKKKGKPDVSYERSICEGSPPLLSPAPRSRPPIEISEHADALVPPDVGMSVSIGGVALLGVGAATLDDGAVTVWSGCRRGGGRGGGGYS